MHKDSPGTLQHWFLNIIHHDKTIEIPEYQRSYSWEDAHVKTLIEDLKNSKTQYFLGLFLVEESNERIYLVDGQQRFTTIYMLLNAIYKRRSDITYQSDNKTINIKDFLFRDNLPRLVLQENAFYKLYKQ